MTSSPAFKRLSILWKGYQMFSKVPKSPLKGPVPVPVRCESTASTKRKPFITISVDGNISSGKSTLVKAISDMLAKKEEFVVEMVPEPLEKWTNMRGHNVLQMLYDDTKANNFLFQHYVQLTRLFDTIKEPEPVAEDKKVIRLMERSMQNNRYCFSELAKRLGTLNEPEFSVLAEWYKWVEQNVDLPLDVVIYLRTDPAVAFQRMQNRGRAEESTVPSSYLQALHTAYEDWLICDTIKDKDCTTEKDPRNYDVIVLDANRGKEDVTKECIELLNEYLSRKLKTRSLCNNISSPMSKKPKMDSTVIVE